MGTMESLMVAGLDVELEAIISQYFKTDDEAKKQQLRDTIDEKGIKSTEVMRLIGAFQRDKTMETGSFKDLAKLQERLESGNGVGATETPAAAAETSEAAPKKAKKQKEEVDLSAVEWSEEMEARVKEKLEADEEKWRQRKEARERRIREQMVLSQKKRAERLGIKTEEQIKIASLQQKNKDALAQIKKLREEMKANKEEINTIRPKRARKPMSDEQKAAIVAKRKATLAAKKAAK